MNQPVEQSCIKTELKIPKPAVNAWLAKCFPELLHGDLRIVEAWSSPSLEHVSFTIEHTVQPPKQARPIMLAPPQEDDDPPDNPMKRIM